MYNTLNNPSAHPSYSHYYLLRPSTLFFFCTSYCFALFLFHCTFYSYFSFFTIYMLLCCVTLYNFYFYYFALSTERTWFDYISLLIIPCIIYYVTNKETLNLEPWISNAGQAWCVYWRGICRSDRRLKSRWRKELAFRKKRKQRRLSGVQTLIQSSSHDEIPAWGCPENHSRTNSSSNL